MLKILVLGPPAILIDDQPLDIQRRQLRTLLFYLACQQDGVGRGELLTCFWPDAKETDARRQLRELLSKLRAQLPGADDLQTDHDRVWLNKQTVYTDIQDFLTLIQPAQSILDVSDKNATLSDSLVESLEKAVAIWRSPSFLAGARISNTREFDDWLQQKASSLEYYRLQSLESLANHFTTTREVDKAIFYVHKALEADTLNEFLQTQLLSLLYSTGRISEAQTYYSYLKELYRREFNTDPPVILRNTMDEVTKSPYEGRTRQLGQELWHKPGKKFYVGRVQELEKIESTYETGGILIVSGEIGSGKTHFVQQFYAGLNEKPRLFYTNCQSEDTNLPLQPIINLIKNYITPEDWEHLEKRWLKSLSILVPDIIQKTQTGHEFSDSSSKEGRGELFEAIHQLFLSASRNSRLLLVLDDMQWSDQDTFEALMYLFQQRFFGTCCFCTIITRTEIQDHQIYHILFNSDEHKEIPRISLGPLTRPETSGLAKHLLGKTLAEGFIDRLYKATGGNPLFIIETINTLLISINKIPDSSQEDIPLTDSLSAIILEKEKYLSSSAREVLSIAAVYGMEFQFDVLEQMRFCESGLLVHCLEELEEKQFIHPLSGSGSLAQYAFNHNLIRDSLISRLSQARLFQLHEQIARAMTVLKGSLNNRQSSIIARHFEAAGKSVQAFQYWVKAGLYARSLFSIHEAFNSFQRANAIRLDFGVTISINDLYELFFEWGDLANNIMDISALDECYSAMHETGQQLKNPLLIGAGLSGLALIGRFNLELEKAQALLEQSIQILDGTNNLYEKIIARSRMGMVLARRMQNEKAIEIYQQAIDLGKKLPNQVVRQAVASVQYQLSMQHSLMGWPEKAKVVGKQALLNAYLLVSKPTAQSKVHLSLALAAYYSGSFSEAREQIKRCLKANESIQNMRLIALATLLQARIHCHHGRLDFAWELTKKALTQSDGRFFSENIAEAFCVRGDILLLIQDFPDAIVEYAKGCEEFPNTFAGMDCYFRMGYAMARNGDMEKGMEMLEKVMRLSQEAGYYSIYLPARHLFSYILREDGKLSEARKIEEEVIRETSARGLSMVVFPESAQQGRLIYESMDNSQAEIIYSNLISIAEIKSHQWIDLLLHKITSNQVKDDRMDKNRFIRFLKTQKKLLEKATSSLNDG